MKFHEDDRAQRLLDLFPISNGQINVSYVQPGHVVAWHKHKKQTDYWCCLQGSFKVGLCLQYDHLDQKIEWCYLSDKHFHILKIEPGIWHGYMALQHNSILLYYLDQKYDPEDEFKVSPGYFNEKWEIENK